MPIHRYILHNGEIKDGAEASLSPGQLGLLSGWGVFSTLRVVDGVMFAWERHWERMCRDAALMNVAMPASADATEKGLLRLIGANAAPNCTLRIAVVRNRGGIWEGPCGRDADVIALTADSKQWGDTARLSVQPHGRYAAGPFSGTKILSWAHNLRWAEIAHEDGFDEVILLNERDRVSECTSANIFAAFGGEVFTPPLADGCLPGITREVLLHEIHVAGIVVAERSLCLDQLYEASDVFITSTNRSLIGVSEIAGRETRCGGTVCKRLSAALESFIRNDIARRRKSVIAA